jgi:hypothetical protein
MSKGQPKNKLPEMRQVNRWAKRNRGIMKDAVNVPKDTATVLERMHQDPTWPKWIPERSKEDTKESVARE